MESCEIKTPEVFTAAQALGRYAFLTADTAFLLSTLAFSCSYGYFNRAVYPVLPVPTFSFGVTYIVYLLNYLHVDLQVHLPGRNIDYVMESLTVTGTGIPAGTGRVG